MIVVVVSSRVKRLLSNVTVEVLSVLDPAPTDEMLRQYRQALDDDSYFRGRAGTDMLADEYPRATDGLHDGAGVPQESPCTRPAQRPCRAAMHPGAVPQLAYYCAGGAGAGAMHTTI